ncbi:putative urea ABC transporter substrate-binding protein [Hyphomicrobium sp.]|uniref:putative urea ABC transporter substrate-binding protein n=1 Tax=Hyphomicrobium sp. TaxID=82 RepID=UPI002D7A3D88|nr:putative urea ABC transporter substrate-binding protein [Hyphomicrobium sp.]HET6389399.1 putative urea ABC transporter substrate-binding protein [Hyphomicrobium sp.]
MYKRLLTTVVALTACLGVSMTPALAEKKDSFKIAWSIYAGWMPWGYLNDQGILKKWADKYNIKIELVQLNDYIEAINQYTAGKFDGCAMATMDTLTIPAAGGVDTTVLIMGDYSNGNDGMVLKKGKSIADVKGQKVHLVEFSVSHYLLARALSSAGLTERDVMTVNTSESDSVSAFTSSDEIQNIVSWNPMLSDIKKVPGATSVFDSSQIPGEIMDVMTVNTETLKDNPELGKALTGAWYEMLALMNSGTPEAEKAIASMAAASATDAEGFKAQLAMTYMFYTPADALKFQDSASLKKTMELVRSFSFDHGLLGQNAKSKDVVGIEFPDGSTIGDAKNVKFRFNTTFTALAAEGKL